MKRATHPLAMLAVLTLVTLLFPSQAHAYLDPGTGSYIMQLILAGIVGTIFAIRIFWGRIKSFLKSLSSKVTSPSQDDES
jgi:hypothetical protein